MTRGTFTGLLASSTARRPWASWTAATAWGASAGLSAAAGLSIAAGLADLVGSGGDAALLVATGVVMGLLGVALFTRVGRPDRVRAADVLAATTFALATLVVLVAVLYLLTGATRRVDDALFEAASGVTTTAFSVIDPAGLGYGLLFLRAGSQWVGGFAALVLGIAVLPFCGFAQEFTDRSRFGGSRPLAPTQRVAIRNIALLYVPVSLTVWIAYALVGVGPFDGLLLAMSTVSTGGFTGAGGTFADPAVQWVAIVAMLLAGTSLVVLWRLAVGRARGLLGSTDLQVYLGMHVVAVVLLLAWSGASGLAGVRRALFTVASSISTTGFALDSLDGWATATPVLLLLLVSVGAMSGSASGGFQILRHRALLKLALREMVRQLHPRAVARIRMSGRITDEDTLRQIVVLQFLFVAVVFGTGFVVAALGLDLATAISAGVHATATAGPVRALDGTVIEVTSWSRPIRMALVPAMLFGRLSIYPAVLAVAGLATVIRNRVRLGRRLRAARHRGVE